MPRNDSLFYFFSEKMRLVLMAAVALRIGCDGSSGNTVGMGSSGSGGGATGGGGGTSRAGIGRASSIPQFAHVFIVLEENHSYSDVLGVTDLPESAATAPEMTEFFK
jgi:hypothetical protein